jgi:type I restriction enzyme S subunit
MMEEFPLRILKDINVQKEIAHTLGSIDAKIDNNDCINAELESLAKLIYDYWFVQFEFPNDDGKPYKSSGGKMVWNEIIKREIPDGWDVDKIGVVLKTVLGGTPSTKVKSYWENGNINWLSSAEMAMFPNVKANAKITKEAVENSATKIMPAGTVALSITRYIRPTILGIDTCANQSVVGILESDKIKKDFIYPCIMNLIKKFLTVRTGAQQPHINKETIDSAFIVIPPDNVLDNYYVKIASMYDLIINIAFENKELTELRDFLVPLLMNGQVTINSKLQT